jgi:GNAT superfamily N-acetyltransferase
VTSLYAAYLEEREGAHVYETERGMVTYSFSGPECYIKEIYVLPEYRKDGQASRMADHVVALAKEHGCTYVTGSVCPRAKSATESLRVLLGYGMRLHSISPDGLIIFMKDV